MRKDFRFGQKKNIKSNAKVSTSVFRKTFFKKAERFLGDIFPSLSIFSDDIQKQFKYTQFNTF